MIAHGIDLNSDAIRDFCLKWKIRELSVFGSILRDDFRPDSDVDFLADFGPDDEWDLGDMIEMQDEMKRIIGRDVDLVERKSVERSPNYIRRKHILRTAERLHVEG
jgi:uncharacterized protein